MEENKVQKKASLVHETRTIRKNWLTQLQSDERSEILGNRREWVWMDDRWARVRVSKRKAGERIQIKKKLFLKTNGMYTQKGYFGMGAVVNRQRGKETCAFLFFYGTFCASGFNQGSGDMPGGLFLKDSWEWRRYVDASDIWWSLSGAIPIGSWGFRML